MSEAWSVHDGRRSGEVQGPGGTPPSRPSEAGRAGSPVPDGAPATFEQAFHGWESGVVPPPRVPEPGPPRTGPDPGAGWRPLVAVLVLSLVLVAGVGAALGHLLWTATSPLAVEPPATAPGPGQGSSAAGAPADARSLAKAVSPGLVDIDAVLSAQGILEAGTGMVVGTAGEVVTNNHVIEGESSLRVVDVGDGRAYGATVVGYDRSDDVAVLQLDGAAGLRTVATSPSSGVGPGAGVVGVGNAEGAGGAPSYAAGSVTAVDQSITAADSATGGTELLSHMIATNADVLPGDSGGALVDTAGGVVGMVAAGSAGFTLPATGASGYAIPVREVLRVAAEIEAGRASPTVHIGPTAYLGVLVRPPPSGAGAEVGEVLPGTPAAAAGLAAGDTITAVAGRSVVSPGHLADVLLDESPGDAVPVAYLDPSGQAQTTTVRLGRGPPQ